MSKKRRAKIPPFRVLNSENIFRKFVSKIMRSCDKNFAQLQQMTEKTVENMEELPDEVLQEQLVTDSLEAAEMVQTETIKRYVPIDIRV